MMMRQPNLVQSVKIANRPGSVIGWCRKNIKAFMNGSLNQTSAQLFKCILIRIFYTTDSIWEMFNLGAEFFFPVRAGSV